MSIKVNCIVCDAPFDITPSRVSINGNYCSTKCMSINNTDDNVTCYVCDAPFHIKQFHLNKMKTPERICCSKECSNIEKSERIGGTGNHQYNIKGELNSSYKSDIKTSYYGYVMIRSLNHPKRNTDNFIMFHRLVYEEYLNSIKDFEFLEFIDGKYVLSSDVVIHHKDENKLNNSISNLKITTLSKHTTHHNLLSPVDKDSITGRFISNGEISSGSLYKKHKLDAGLDVSSAESVTIQPHSSAIISTKLIISIPDGCVGLLWSRSGLSVKHNIECGAGCIDAGYTGEVKVHLYNHGNKIFVVETGDRIAQLLTIPINLEQYDRVDELSDTDRGSGGFGSTDKK